MKYRVIIPNNRGKFPIKGLNELLNGRMYNFRTKKYHNPVKLENDKVCRLAIQKCLRGAKIDKPIKCHFTIYAKDKKHDKGNISSAVEKSFLDALQQKCVIQNDTFDLVDDSTFLTILDRNNPRIEVEIEVLG